MHHKVDRCDDARARSRGQIAVAVDVRVPCGVRTKGNLIDLSETGFRLECMTILEKDRSFFLTIPTFAQLEARIAWKSDWTYGCEFAQPLHPAIYQHILDKHPAIARPLC